MEKTAKQKAIEKAYGKHWDKVKKFIDYDYGSVPTFPYLMDEGHEKDGLFWKQLGYHHNTIEDIFGDCEPSRWRPISLQGIEHNNGWIKIESEEDLPKEVGTYDVIRKQRPNEISTGHFEGDKESEFSLKAKTENWTHWRNISKLLPIY